MTPAQEAALKLALAEKHGTTPYATRLRQEAALLLGQAVAPTLAPAITTTIEPERPPEPPRRPAPVVTDVDPGWTDDIPLGAEHEAVE